MGSTHPAHRAAGNHPAMTTTNAGRRETAAEKALRLSEVDADSVRLVLRRAGLAEEVHSIRSGQHFTYVYLLGAHSSFHYRDAAGRELTRTGRAQAIADALNAAFHFAPFREAFVEEPWSVAIYRRQP